MLEKFIYTPFTSLHQTITLAEVVHSVLCGANSDNDYKNLETVWRFS